MLVLIALIIAGLLFLGAFPPRIEPHAVERTIPNERFGTR